MLTPAFNRRSFLRFAAIASAGAALPIVNESHLAMAQMSAHHPAPAAGAIMINANENPLGPCASARATIASLIPDGGRYQDDLTETLTKTIAAKEGLKPEYVAVYAGSSEPCITRCSPSPPKPAVTSRPTPAMKPAPTPRRQVAQI